MRVRVNHEAVAEALDLKTSQIDLKIATIKEDSASRGGYKVTITSLNKGVMVAENAPEAATHAYEIKYNGRSINLENHSGTTIHLVNNASGKDKELSISYRGSDKISRDSYSDTVKLTYTAN
ncbi:hypothetical protein SHI21_07285 [Bacteriovorax sp. PP10]|uniref:Uncharacterized protein n=1 Tax=Bacteriovorax antarcticus TaxID=3088717 RepID=A0ABU5VSL9_9BACT|nr:hypothetical protein [Bacteriovorax sp. PP10]MEA9355996.1 hypothetical protein [Bacteriovorax sp. PP10]